MPKYPKDCPARIIGAEARKLVHYTFSSKRWEYREITGTDYGQDCIIELVEDEQFKNKKLDGQIKGTQNPKLLQDGTTVTFSMDVKTIEYGLSSSNAFILFLVDISDEIVYFLPLQEYFIDTPSLFERLEKNNETMNVHISKANIVSKDDHELQQLAKSTYHRKSQKILTKMIHD